MHLINSYGHMLGGWHRLWFMLCGLSLFLILATNTWFVGPIPESYLYKNEFYNALSPESKNTILEIDVHEPKALSTTFAHVNNHNSDWLVMSNIDGKLKDSVLVKMPNNQIIAFVKHASINAMQNTCKEYWGIVEKYAHKQKKVNPFLISILSDWLIWCIFLYILGVSVAWVHQGFRNNAVN